MPYNYDLGGTMKGRSAKPVVLVNREGERGFDRDILRRSMGYSFLSGDKPYTTFRLNQNVVPICAADGSKDGVPPCKGEMGNARFVYDSSDYTRFKKLSAKNRNYNDSSFVGNEHSGAQSSYRMTH